jgi:hypothetical protein
MLPRIASMRLLLFLRLHPLDAGATRSCVWGLRWALWGSWSPRRDS